MAAVRHGMALAAGDADEQSRVDEGPKASWDFTTARPWPSRDAAAVVDLVVVGRGDQTSCAFSMFIQYRGRTWEGARAGLRRVQARAGSRRRRSNMPSGQ